MDAGSLVQAAVAEKRVASPEIVVCDTRIMGVVGVGAIGGSTLLTLLAIAATYGVHPTSVRSMRREISELGGWIARLERQGRIHFVYGPSTPGGAVAPYTTSVAPFADDADRPWSSILSQSHMPVSPSFSDRPMPAYRPIGVVLELRAVLFPQLRRLIDVVRAVLRLVLIRVLSALARCPAALDFVQLLLAALRCFGLRTEPGDYALPSSRPCRVGRALGCVS